MLPEAQDFDEALYLEIHRDVLEAVNSGAFVSGWDHFNRFGRDERRSLRSRSNPRHGRIVIAGTGRSGTTLLVQVFTALGFDTGFTIDDALTRVDAISNAGLEHALSEQSPTVVKWPWLAKWLDGEPIDPNLQVKWLIVPMRDLSSAAGSRRRVHDIAVSRDIDPHSYPGGLWLTDNPEAQEGILLKQFYDTVQCGLRSDLHPMLLAFPRFGREPDYLWHQLTAVWNTYGVSRSDLRMAMSRVFDPSKIHIA